MKFKTVKEFQSAIDRYFKDCDKNGRPYTITGLALALKTSRETLINYEKRDEFFDACKEAKLRCENYAEELLLTHGGSGPIFALKNYGWKDRTEVHQEHTYTQMGRISAKTKDGSVKEINFNIGKKTK